MLTEGLLFCLYILMSFFDGIWRYFGAILEGRGAGVQN